MGLFSLELSFKYIYIKYKLVFHATLCISSVVQSHSHTLTRSIILDVKQKEKEKERRILEPFIYFYFYSMAIKECMDGSQSISLRLANMYFIS